MPSMEPFNASRRAARRAPARPRRWPCGFASILGTTGALAPPAARRTRRPPSRTRGQRKPCGPSCAGGRVSGARGASHLCASLLSASLSRIGSLREKRPPVCALRLGGPRVGGTSSSIFDRRNALQRSQCFPAASAAAAACRRRSPRSREASLTAAMPAGGRSPVRAAKWMQFLGQASGAGVLAPPLRRVRRSVSRLKNFGGSSKRSCQLY